MRQKQRSQFPTCSFVVIKRPFCLNYNLQRQLSHGWTFVCRPLEYPYLVLTTSCSQRSKRSGFIRNLVKSCSPGDTNCGWYRSNAPVGTISLFKAPCWNSRGMEIDLDRAKGLRWSGAATAHLRRLPCQIYTRYIGVVSQIFKTKNLTESNRKTVHSRRVYV